MLEIFYLTGFASLILFIITFFIAVLIRNNSIVDIIWGIGFGLIAVVTYSVFGGSLVSKLILVYSLMWSLRLSIHIFLRNYGKGEDFRYLNWRQEWGRAWVLRSFFQIFLLQWVLMQIVSLPIVLGIVGARPINPIWLVLGVVVWLTGFFFEVVGDYQLTQFKKIKSNKGKILTTGLWSLTRHPNYFGEATLWWGIAFLSYGVSHSLLSFLGPVAIDSILLFVSGIPLLEKKYQGRSDWRAYAKKTPAFFPALKVG